MKSIFTILFLFTFSKSFSQYTAYWSTGNKEIGVVSYEIQQTSDTTKKWNTLATILPIKKDSVNEYNYGLSDLPYYYRVQANMLKNNKFFTKTIKVSSGTLPVNIINISIKNKVMQWTTQNESNISYYVIEETKDGVNYVETIRVQPKGNSTYKVNLK